MKTTKAMQTFLVNRSELRLRFIHPAGLRQLSFGNFSGSPLAWKTSCREKLAELLHVAEPASHRVRTLRQSESDDVIMKALVMEISEQLWIPAYLLSPLAGEERGVVMAIHGHGEVEPCLGTTDDYHHAFALRLAQAGYTVLCPELRGFGTLRDLAHGAEGYRLDYWNWGRHMAYSLVTDSFLHGRPLIGQTVQDLLNWEQWLAEEHSVDSIDVAGISYGGDLALTYPVFSERVRKIFASGTLGSLNVIFSRCYNAPAHCIPDVLSWMDRSDIAGLNAPRPIALHYGALDTPGGGNYSASYNETVAPSLQELREIYGAFGATEAVKLIVSSGKKHEMDNAALLAFLNA